MKHASVFLLMIMQTIYFASSFTIFNSNYANKYLTLKQWDDINTIIKSPDASPKIKTVTQKIIFKHYEKWALQKTSQFKTLHYYKCKNINVADLSIYALQGLNKAVQNYNGSGKFATYADIYISSYLYTGMTNLLPLTIIPKSYRRNQEWKKKNNHVYRNSLNPHFIGFTHNFVEKKQETRELLDKYYEEDYYSNTWDFINKENDAFTARVFRLKYSFDFKTLKANKQIAEEMECSEETVRQKIMNVKEKLKIKIENKNIK
jgi:RNA polymerase sigma factor (sigma-70 family)